MERAKKIGAIADELEVIASRITDLEQEEQDALDALPEAFQQGEKGEAMQEVLNALQTAAGEVEQAAEELRGIEGV